MSPSRGLAGRLSWALVGSAAGLATVMAMVASVSYERIEHSLLNTSLNEELDSLIEWQVPPQRTHRPGAPQQYFRSGTSAAALPADFAGLPPGQYHDIVSGGRPFHLLVRELAPGDRAYLLQDVSLIEEREDQLRAVLAGSVALVALLGWILSRWIAALTLRPLRSLVRRLGELDPERVGQRLHDVGTDPDLLAVQAVLNAHMAARDAVVERERAFAAAAAHELRTPVAVLRATLELARARGGSDESLNARALRAAESLSGQLDALLALSRSRRAPDPQPVDLAAVMREVVDRCHAEAEDAGVRVVPAAAAPAAWQGSSEVALIVLSNLLRNAIRAARHGETRRVELAVEGPEIRIADSGPGVDPGLGDRVFEPGIRGREGGTGMGLYIARELARRYGGDVLLLDRQPGPGTVAVWRRGGH